MQEPVKGHLKYWMVVQNLETQSVQTKGLAGTLDPGVHVYAVLTEISILVFCNVFRPPISISGGETFGSPRIHGQVF